MTGGGISAQSTKLTGVDARTYAGTSLLLTALRLTEIQGDARPG